MKKPLAIIPARGGSKRFPRKNIALLAGKPLLAWAIDVAIESGVFDRVCVSSEDHEILDIAEKYGAEPRARSAELAADNVQLRTLIPSVLTGYADEGLPYETFGLVVPTSPLRTPQDIRNAYELFIEEECHSVMSIVKVEHPPQQCVWMPQVFIEPFLGADAMRLRSQDLPSLYHHNGAIIFMNSETFIQEQMWYCPKSLPYVMPPERSVDIDTPLDLVWVEHLLSLMQDSYKEK